VEHHDDGHAGLGRQLAEEALQGVDAAGGGPDADDGMGSGSGRLAVSVSVGSVLSPLGENSSSEEGTMFGGRRG
jgi:hypothetical protein